MKIKSLTYFLSGIFGVLIVSGFVLLNHELPEYIGFLEAYLALFITAYCFYKGVEYKKNSDK
ncbi:hypothetical protein [Vibrio coralliilyticus]|uniref:Uncharacterized protein n=1 Tax=Vibrio coralliilyticus TaxID=190893 RepID=A0AAP6ZVB1_9VIBR|nr:hypothetical protein [Vibrio coralliilyticus]NOI31864.1 hypothetical protein [Vibrio coralliilyticus]NOJ25308.1 hypothetical protein [Vibrio coralliilyticus]